VLSICVRDGGSSKASISARSDFASSTNLCATVPKSDIRQLRVPIACGKRTGELQPLPWNALGQVTLSAATLESCDAMMSDLKLHLLGVVAAASITFAAYAFI
jgi:hypothetical protein